MEAGFIALVILVAVICFAVGIHIGKRSAKHQEVQGVLNIDCGESDASPYLFLQLEVPIEDIVNRKQALFDVNVFRSNSQK